MLENILKPIRERRRELAKDPEQIMEILKKSTQSARDLAGQTLKEVKAAMKIKYY